MCNNKEKIATSIHALLFVLQRLGGMGDFHKLFKILYFADQKHLAKYGSLITDDNYIAMNNGPVPSIAYDILKALRGEGLLEEYRARFQRYFTLLSKYEVKSSQSPNMDELSETARECIDESIKENDRLGFPELTTKSHDAAWERTSADCEMDVMEIAKAAGANEGMLEYIKESKSTSNI
jgi:uncharacterized phage-associated protein